MWRYIFTAIALVLVIEGILPALVPDKYRQYMATLIQQSDRNLRRMGLVMMIIGAIIMYLVHSGIF